VRDVLQALVQCAACRVWAAWEDFWEDEPVNGRPAVRCPRCHVVQLESETVLMPVIGDREAAA
jgi:hypothetical protein